MSETAILRETALIGRARAGDEASLAALIEQCRPAIERLAFRLRSGQVERDDLAQEGLLGVLAAVRTYREGAGASFGTYAVTCARNRMLTALRRSQTPGVPLVSLEEAEVLPADQTGDPVYRLDRQDDAARLAKRLRECLTPTEYDVLTGYLNGYTYSEIAAARELTAKAVDNALQRVRRKLSLPSFWTF